jgi:WD40 repeat protein
MNKQIDKPLRKFFLFFIFTLFISANFVFADNEEDSDEEVIVKPAKVELGRPVSFGKDILPIFKAKCLACHSSSEAESEVNLESLETIKKGGDSGELFVVKDPEKSLLYQVVTRNADSPMPPLPNEAEATMLTPKEVGLIRQWILEGAKADPKGISRKINWRPVPAQVKSIYSLDISNEGRFVAYGRANQIYVQDLLSGEQSFKLLDPNLASIKYHEKSMYPGGAAHRDSVYSLSFSDDGQWLASGGYRVVKLWKRSAKTPNHSVKTDQQVVKSVVTSDGTILAEAGADHVIRLRQLSDGKVLKELKGHTDLVTGIQIRSLSADSSNLDITKKLAALELVSVSKDQTVKIWNLTDGSLKYSLKTPSVLHAVLFNKDGSQILSAGVDSVIRLWKNDPALYQDDSKPGKPVLEIKGHSKPVTALALVESTGTQIVSGSEDGTVRLWNLADGKELKNLNHQSPVTAVAVSSEGKRIASSGGNLVRLWNLADGKQVAELKGDQTLQIKLKKTEDEVTIAKQQVAHLNSIVKSKEKDVKDREETIKKSKARKEETAKKLKEAQTKEKAEADSLEKVKKEAPQADKEKKKLTEEEKKAAKKKEDDFKKKLAGAEKKYTAAKDALDKAILSDKSAVRAITLNERSLVGAKKRLELSKADEKTGTEHQKTLEASQKNAQKLFTDSVKNVSSLQFSANGKTLVTSGGLSIIQLWNSENGIFVDSFSAHSKPVTQAQILADGRIVSVSQDQNVFIWNSIPVWKYAGVIGPNSEKPLDVGQSQLVSRVMAVDFSNDGKMLVTGGGAPSRNGELKIWDLSNRKLIRTIEKAHTDTVMGVEFSYDSKKIASASADKFVKVFETSTGKYIRSFEGHTNYVLDVSWKADSLTLASAGADNVIKVWNSETGEQRRTIKGFSKQVASVQFIGVGDDFVSCSGDHLVRLHKMSNGKMLLNYTGATEFAHAVAASKNGEVVASGGQDGIVRIWRGKNTKPVKTLSP